MTADILSVFKTGGPVVAVLAAMSVIALAMTLFKIWQFASLRVGKHRVALGAVEMWIAGDRQAAYAAVEHHRSPLSKVVAHAMRGKTHGGHMVEDVKEDVMRIAQGELLELRRYLRGIEVIAQSAPLLGLLGTVIGMIQAFNQLEASGAAVNPAQLAGGIWTALLATAMGLGVAIVFSIVGAWFESKVENERAIMEMTLTGFFAHRITDSQQRDFGEVTDLERKAGTHAR